MPRGCHRCRCSTRPACSRTGRATPRGVTRLCWPLRPAPSYEACALAPGLRSPPANSVRHRRSGSPMNETSHTNTTTATVAAAAASGPPGWPPRRTVTTVPPTPDGEQDAQEAAFPQLRDGRSAAGSGTAAASARAAMRAPGSRQSHAWFGRGALVSVTGVETSASSGRKRASGEARLVQLVLV